MKNINVIVLSCFIAASIFLQLQTDAFGEVNSQTHVSQQKPITIGYQNLPDSFKKLMQNSELTFSVVTNGVRFDNVSAKLKGNILYLYPDSIKKLNLAPSASNRLKQTLLKGLSLSRYNTSHSVINHYQIDFSKMLVTVVLSKQFSTKNNIAHSSPYLPNSSISHLASVFSYDLNATGYFNHANGENTESISSSDEDSYNAYLNNVSGFKNNSLRTGFNLYRTGKVSTNQLDHLYIQHDFVQSKVRFGYFQNNTININADLPYSFTGSSILFSMGSSSDRLLNKSSKSLTPVNIFLSASSSVRVYKNNQLIYSNFLSVGAHSLDTSDFPSGRYSVRIDVYQNGVKVQSYRRDINKPSFGLNSILSTPKHFQYSVWTGAVDTKSAYSFNESVAGFSINTLLGSRNAVQFGSYAEVGRYNLGVTELSDYFYTPFGTLFATLGLDSHHGYARNVGYSVDITDNLSVNTSYNNVNSTSVISPFFKTRSVSIGADFNTQKYGTLSVSDDHSMDDGTNQVIFSYDKTLYQFNNLTIMLELNQSEYQSGSELRNVQSNTTDRSIMLDFTYALDDGGELYFQPGYVDSSGSNSSNFNMHWTNNQTDSLGFSGLYSNWSHTDNSDNFAVNASATTKVVTGTVGLSKTFSSDNSSGNNGIGYNADISGGIVLADNHIAHSGFTNSSGIQSGVFIDADIPKGSALNAVIGDSASVIHKGANFIPESSYKTYNLYLTQNNDSSDVLNFDPLDTDFTLYPGNIKYIRTDAWKQQIIVGELMYKGKPLSNVEVQSQISAGDSDQKGYFLVPTKMGSKQLTVKLGHSKTCLVHLPEKHSDKSSISVGVLNCSTPKGQNTDTQT